VVKHADSFNTLNCSKLSEFEQIITVALNNITQPGQIFSTQSRSDAQFPRGTTKIINFIVNTETVKIVFKKNNQGLILLIQFVPLNSHNKELFIPKEIYTIDAENKAFADIKGFIITRANFIDAANNNQIIADLQSFDLFKVKQYNRNSYNLSQNASKDFLSIYLLFLLLVDNTDGISMQSFLDRMDGYPIPQFIPYINNNRAIGVSDDDIANGIYQASLQGFPDNWYAVMLPPPPLPPPPLPTPLEIAIKEGRDAAIVSDYNNYFNKADVDDIVPQGNPNLRGIRSTEPTEQLEQIEHDYAVLNAFPGNYEQQLAAYRAARRDNEAGYPTEFGGRKKYKKNKTRKKHKNKSKRRK